MEARLWVEDEDDYYPVHEEDNVPQTPAHVREWTQSMSALQVHLPHLWITGDVCLYWEEGNTDLYVASDIAAIQCPPPDKPPRTYRAWSAPPLLFVAEFASRRTKKRDKGPKVNLYEQQLKVPEYLYVGGRRDVRLWRMINEAYHLTQPDENGRLWSEQLQVSFGYERRGILRIYDANGRRLLTHQEERQRADSADERAAAEAQRAEKEAQRAETEARRRIEAEQRLAELAAELERLRRGPSAQPE